jgi:hypothetical protein
MSNGVLDNQTDPNFRSISNNFALFAIARNLGLIQATEDPVVWAVGLTTDPAIQYTAPPGAVPQQRSLFYKSQYSDDTSLVSVHILGNLRVSHCLSDR